MVIGGGLGGLSVGALLHHSDFEVILFEKERNLGGRAAVSEIQGFRVDHGIHASLFAEKSAAGQILKEIGRKLQTRFCGMLFYEDGRFKGLIGRNSVMGTLEKIRLLRNLAGAVRDPSLYRISMESWLERVEAGEGARKFFVGLAIGLMASTHLERLSMGELLQFLRTAVRKRRAFGYPVGGWNSVISPLAASLGNGIRLGCRVKEILVEGRRAVGIVAGGEEVRADYVIFAAPAFLLPSLLPLPKDYRKKLEGIRPTAGVILDFGLGRRVSKIRDVIVTLEPPTLGWFTSNVEPSLAPPGRQLLTTFMPLEVEELKGGAKKALMRLREVYLGIFPEIEKNLLWERGFPTIVNGAELNVHQTRLDRPPVRAPIQNLFLVGDTTNAEGAGAEIAFNSALECVQQIESSSSGSSCS